MPQRVRFVAAVALALSAPRAAMAQRAQPAPPLPNGDVAPCHGPDEIAASLAQYVVNLINSTDPKLMSLRDTVHLTGAKPSDLVLVANKALCAEAAAAYAAAAKVKVTGKTFYVVKVGKSGFIVEPGEAPTKKLPTTWFFSPELKFIRATSR